MATYKPPTVSRTSLKGKAKVQKGKVSGKDVIGVTFEDNTEVTYTIERKNAPAYVATGMFYVRLSSDKQKIESMSPLNGPFTVKVQSFPAKEGEEPAPYVVVNQKYNTSTEKFNVLLEIVGPKFAGMNVLMMLPYYWFEAAFEEVKGEQRQVLGLIEPKKASSGHKLLKNFLQVSGTWDKGPIPYSDNVLPTLQKRMLRAGKEFDIVLEDGFVNAIIMPDDEDFEDEKSSWGDEEEPAQKKPSKPAKQSEDTVEPESWGEPDDVAETPVSDETDSKNSDDAPWDEV